MSTTTTTRSPETPTRRSFDYKTFLANNGALVGLVVLCIALVIATPDFLTGQNLLNIGIQVSTVAVLAFGMTFVIVAGGIDLSVGAVAALSAMASGWFFVSAGLPGWVALLGGLAVGLLAGIVNGAANAYGKLPSFIATLAMLSVARGLTLVISDGRPIKTAAEVSFLGGNIGPVPMPIVILVLAALVASFILNRTVLGRSMYAVGGNAEAARLSGLPVKRIIVTVFALAGVFAALAGLLLADASTPPSRRPPPATNWMPSPPSSSAGRRSPAGSARSPAPSSAPWFSSSSATASTCSTCRRSGSRSSSAWSSPSRWAPTCCAVRPATAEPHLSHSPPQQPHPTAPPNSPTQQRKHNEVILFPPHRRCHRHGRSHPRRHHRLRTRRR